MTWACFAYWLLGAFMGYLFRPVMDAARKADRS
jgi:hypothetical protein